MTAPVHTGVEGFLARYHGLRDRLPGDLGVRDAAAEAFRRAGLPGRRVEAWKYTDLRPVAAAAFAEPLTPLAADSAWLARIPRLDAPRLVFVDGRYRPELSAPPASVHFDSFASHSRFGPLAQPEREPLVALNTMLAEDGAELHVAEGMDAGTLHLVSLATDSTGESTAFHPRHRISLEAGARLTLLETSIGDGAYLHNPVTEVHVGTERRADACAAAGRIHRRFPSRDAVRADRSRGGTYDSFVLNLGGRMVRTEVHAHLAGPNGTAHLNGAQLLAGTQHADFTTVVRPRRAELQFPPDGEERAGGTLARRVPGAHRGRPPRAEDRRLPDEPGAAAVARRRGGYQAGTGNLRRRREVQPWRHGRRTGRGAAVLPAQSRHSRTARRAPSWSRAFLAEALQAVAQDNIRAMLEDSVERWWERQHA